MSTQIYTLGIPLVILLKLVCFISQKLMSLFTSIVAYAYAVYFDHFGYQAPNLNAWNHLTWYSEDRTLQWLQAL